MAQTPGLPDFTKIIKDFDATKMADQISTLMKNYKLPGVDVDSIVANQRKTVEALTSANRVALEGMQAVIKRQVEILQETMNETAKAFDSIAKAGSPPEAAAKQAELAKSAYERALSNARELAEMITKAQKEATDAINARISEFLDEYKDTVLKLKSGASSASAEANK
jgi:phasin family protein